MSRRVSAALACAASLVCAAAVAQRDPPLPLILPEAAVSAATVEDPPGFFAVARAVWDGQAVPMLGLTGSRQRLAYRLPPDPGTLAALVSDAPEALEAAGYELLLSCDQDSCGGFDFRHRLAVLPLPDMYVDLGRFRYVSAVRRDDTSEPEALISVLASASPAAVHLQIDRITRIVAAPTAAPAPEPVENIAADRPDDAAEEGVMAFGETGSLVLEDLAFAVGAATLADDAYPSLAALAGLLAEMPEARIMLVGHTDASGAPEANREISRRRAQAVADRLVQAHGVNPARLRVEGAGDLAPRADNRTEVGRALNRRVSAVLLPPG